MKYALPSGEASIIKTLDRASYMSCICGNKVIPLTLDGECKIMTDKNNIKYISIVTEKELEIDGRDVNIYMNANTYVFLFQFRIMEITFQHFIGVVIVHHY